MASAEVASFDAYAPTRAETEPFDEGDSSIDALAEMDAVPSPHQVGAESAQGDPVAAPQPTSAPIAEPTSAGLSESVAAAIAASESFDATLDLPKLGDSIEERRARLASRMKAARTTFKALGYLDISDDERKEVFGSFAEYDAKLKNPASRSQGDTPEKKDSDAPEKKDSDALHRSLSKGAVDELERVAARVEDRLLALDEYVSPDIFRARIRKDKHPAKLLLRYARVLGSRRFNVGYRRDRFEFLVTELLSIQAPDGTWTLMPRDDARRVLHYILAGLPQGGGQAGDRDAACAYLRESLVRLAAISSYEDFFESGYFLDVHGYKVSMRELTTQPEFLYLSAAVNVEVHNRIERWIANIEGLEKANQLTQTGPPREFLYGQLYAQEESVQAVFGGFRKAKERQLLPGAQRTQPVVKEGAAKAKPKAAQQKPSRTSDLAELLKDQVTKMVLAAVVVLVSLGVVLYETDTVTIAEHSAVALSAEKVRDISPLLANGVVYDKKRVEGDIRRAPWYALEARQRRDTADQINQKLKKMGLPTASIMDGRTAAIKIETGLVVFVDVTTTR